MSSKNCAGCAKLLPKHEYLRCSICKAGYDLSCINISSDRYKSFYAANNERKSTWKCSECKLLQKGNLNTPLRSLPNHEKVNPSPILSGGRPQKDEPKDLCNVECLDPLTETKLYINEMRAMRLEMSIFRETMAELSSTIKAQNKRMDNLETRIEALENKTADTKCDEVATLKQTISQLKSEIEERDQDLLINDIEISNIPESVNENATHILMTIAKKLGTDVDERDVVSVERVGRVRAPVEGAAPPRPRPLVARLARRAPRDALLQAARVRRGLTTQDMNLSGPPRSFYVNERLTRANRQLFQQTREAAKTRNWKYVWTREGKIFMRQEQGKPLCRIRSELELKKVFSDTTVSS